MSEARQAVDAVLDLDHPAATDASHVGAKASTLAALRAAGERVPEGLVVLPGSDPAVAAAHVVERFGDRPLAVRSSSVAEDLAAASYAGQYVTVLDVRGAEAVTQAIAAVQASARAASERGYGDEGAMAVLVMPLVPAQSAGVVFTANPVTGDDETLVDAVAGLGEALVSGEATPERWVAAAGTVPIRQDGDATVLSPAEAAEIAALARRIAQRQGRPQDVEWALAGGELHLLQARPITALPVPIPVAVRATETWIRADEALHQPQKPFEFHAWAPRLDASAREAFAEAGAPLETMRYAQIGGWTYARTVPLGDDGNDGRAAPPGWVFGLLVRLIPGLRRRLKVAAAVWDSDIGARAIEAWEGGGRDAMRQRTRELRTTDRASLSDEALAAHLEASLDHVQAAAHAHMRLPVLATFLPMGRLGVLAERCLGWKPDRVFDLLRGHSEVSRAGGRALDALAEAIAADPDALRLLDDAPGLLVHRGPGGAALRAFLDGYGHQVVGFDFTHPTWAEDLRPVLTMVRHRLDRGPSDADGERHVADAAEREALEALAGRPAELEAFERALADARRGSGYNDDTEIDVLQSFALLRYAACEAGRRLARRGTLASAEAIWWLSPDEVLDALRTGRVDADIERRRAEHRWALAHPGPKRYGPLPAPPPDLSWCPPKIRDFFAAMMWVMEQISGTPSDPPVNGEIVGVGASAGRVTGPVRVIRSPAEFDRVQPGDVLVCPCTLAAWSVVFPLIGGIVTEVGGPLSHPAILAREFGIPAVVGVHDVTTRLADGEIVTVDGATGHVQRG